MCSVTNISRRSLPTGPDQVIPVDDLIATDRFGAVKLKIGARGPSAQQPISVHTLLRRTAQK